MKITSGARDLRCRHAIVRLAVACSSVVIASACHSSLSAAQDDRPALLEGFTVSTVYRDTDERFQALYYKNGHRARVDIRRNMDRAQAASLIEARLHSMRAVYDRRLSPYPGELSNEIACDEAFQPRFGSTSVNDVSIEYVRGLATDRLTFGACTDDLTTYEGLVAWYWCPTSQALVQLEMMIPKEDTGAETRLERYLASLDCRE